VYVLTYKNKIITILSINDKTLILITNKIPLYELDIFKDFSIIIFNEFT